MEDLHNTILCGERSLMSPILLVGFLSIGLLFSGLILGFLL
jgi:hypothetical protein